MESYIFIDLLSDWGFKQAFGKENCSEEFLIDFLNQIFIDNPEFRNIVSVQYRNVEKSPSNRYGRENKFDLICETNTGYRFIVEMQRRNQKNFTKRAFYYLSRELVEQGMRIKEKERWNYEYMPVVGVFITEFDTPGFEGRIAIHATMADTKTHKTLLEQIKCTFIQINNFHLKKEECHTGFEKWMYILKNMERLEEIPFKTYRDGIFERLGELSKISNMSSLERAEYDADLKWSRDYYATMEYAREEGLAKGLEKGIKEGLEKGIKEGLAEGRAEGRAEANKEIAKSLKTLGVEIDKIIKSTGLSKEEISRL